MGSALLAMPLIRLWMSAARQLGHIEAVGITPFGRNAT
jgi:hypothetical protein